ncbi:MAG TPA: SdrD B-like domain-containing protein, partial [Leadbetterella sp.]|nr:SdrD B-like domain-containing protein [Leadbetterella sp.]
MRDFTKQHSSNTPDLRNEHNGSPFKAFSAFAISVISLIIHFGGLFKPKSLFGFHRNGLKLSFAKSAMALVALLIGMANVSKAQNAPSGYDKYYMLVGELLGNSTAGTDVYEYSTGGGIVNCSLPGGGGEGMVIDYEKKLAYIATCCSVGEVRIYDYTTATFLTPIKLPAGEDILDVTLSADNDFLYVATYNFIYKIDTNTKGIVGQLPKSTFNIAGTLFTSGYTVSNFWGIAIHPTNSRIYATTNWQTSNDDSKIVSFTSTFSNPTVLVTAPAGFHYRGIVFDAAGNIWATAASNSNSVPDRVYKYNSSGVYLDEFLFGTPLKNQVPGTGKVDPYDLAFGPDGKLYITTFWGDCVSRLDVSNSSAVPQTFLPYVTGSQAKSITFVGGNFKCICTSPVLNLSNLTQTSASCNGSIPNNDAAVTIGGLVYSSTDIVKGAIKEGGSFGETPVYGNNANIALGSGQTSLTFTGLKPNTQYTIRVWSGKDACFSDLTFTTYQGVCFTCVCTSNNFAVNGDMASGNPPSSWTTPQGQWSLGTGSSTGNFGVLNNSDFNSDYYAYQDIPMAPGAKITFDALASTHAVSTSGAIAEMYLEFYNGTTLLATSSKSNTTVSYNGTLVALNTIKFIAPANTTHVRIVAHSKGRALKFDNVVLTRCYDQAVNLTQGTVVNPGCNQNNGSITVAGSGGSGEYEYRINGGSWGSSNVFGSLTGTLTGTNYTIDIRDKNAITCTKSLVVKLTCNCSIEANAGLDVVICNTDEAVLDGTVTGVASCGTTGTTNCATVISGSTGWIADLNTAKVCGDGAGAKLWTRSGQGTSSITLDMGSTLPAGTVIRVNLKLEHCDNTFSTQSDAKIEGSLSSGSGFGAIQSSLLFAHTSYKEYTYTLTTPTRYIKVSDNGKCALRLDYVKYTTPDTYTNAVTYAWSGPGIVGATNTKSVTINAAGTYTFTVTGCDGCTDSDIVVVTKNTVTANAGPDKEVCLGETVTLTATAVAGATYEWRSSTSSTVISTNQSITVTPTATIDYVLTVIKNGCDESDEVKVTVKPNITVDAGADKTICNTDEVVLDGSVSGVTSCGTPGVTNCATTIAGSTAWIADLNTAKVCGDNAGAKLWTKSGQGVSSITLDLGSTLPAGTVIRVNLKLEHCENTTSTQSDAKIEASLSSGSGFTSLASSLLFNHTSYKEYTYTLTSSARYIKVSDNGKCALRLDYVKFTTPDTYNNAVTYSWSGPGIVGANNTKSVTVNQAGTYTFTVTGCNGCSGTDIVVVTKNTVSADAGTDKSICVGESVTLTATPVVGATYEWRSSTSSTVISTNPSITVTPTSTTDYVLTVLKNGCDASDEVKVTVNPKPTVTGGNIPSVDPICVGQTATLKAGTWTNASTYTWTGPAGFVTQNGQTATTTVAGTYTLTVTSVAGCSATATVALVVNTNPIINVDSKTVCLGGTATLTASNCVGTVTWNTGATTNTITVTPSAVGEVTYTATCKNTSGCTATGTGKITTLAKPTVSLGPDVEICLGKSIDLVATGCAGGTISWNQGITATTSTVTVSPTTNTTYTVTCKTSNNDGCIATDDILVKVNPNPTGSIPAITPICQTETLNLLSGTWTNAASYKWAGPNSFSSTSQNPTITNTSLAAAGTYTLTVTSASGCTTTATVAVTVNACLSKIGDFVWEDINGNGIQDSGELGIPGVSVTLNGTDAFGNVVSQTATTGANGEYLFDNLVKGTYTVTFGDKAGYVLTSPNKGTDDTKDSDADLTTKQSPVINLGTNASNLTIDAGMYRPASLGDFVWYDVNNNGIQDSGEPGIQGVVATLNGTKGDGTVIAAQTATTNASGIYAFTNLAPGTYTVTFGTVGGYQVAKQDVTGANTDATDVNNDSDINSTTLTSHAATLVSGENDPKLDAGFTKVIDLELDKTVSNSTPNVNEIVTYTIKLTNKGPQIATGVALEDIIPNGLENITLTATNSPQGVIAGNKITFSGLTLLKDETKTFTYTAKVKEPLTGVVYKNVAQVTAANEYDIDSKPNNDDGDQSEDDEDPETIVPQQADLNLVKTVNNATPNVGEKVTFTVKVSNDGPSAATGVQVKDLVPNGYETISAISNSGTLSGSEITWSNLSIPNGQFVNLTFDAIVKVPGTGVDFVNVARVTASDQFDKDSKPNNAANTNGTGGIGSQDSDDTQDAGDEDDGDDAKTTPKVIDLELDKTVSTATPNVGETVTYTLKLTNKGPNTATGVALEDIIPNGLESITLTATNSPQGVIAGNKITFSGLTVLKDETKTFTYTAKVKEPLTGVSYKNVAQVTAANEYDIDSKPNNDDGDQSEDDEDPETIVPQQADLNLVKTVNNATPNVGEKVTFTVKVSNDGPSAATGVQVKDVVPNGYETISAISNSGTLSGSEITWSNLSIPNGQFVNLTFDAIVKVPGTGVDFVNVARVTASDQFDKDSKPNNAANTNGTGGIGSQDADDTQDAGDEDDGDDAKTTPKVIDLELDKTVSTATPNVGETITYTLKLTNKGPNTATGVALEDVIPNGLENITLTATNSPQGVIAGNKITFSGLTVLKDETKTFTYTAKVKEPLTGVSYKNVAQVTAANEYDIDSKPNNDDGDQSEDDEDPETIVPQKADLSLVKTVNDKYPKVGDVVTFTVKVSNGGPQTATNVKVEDVVPNGYSAISSISNSGIVSGNVITWVIPSIASGASSTLTFNVKVGQPATGVSFINLAEVKSVDQYDPDSKPGNGADTNGNGKVGSEDNDDSKDPADEDDGDDAYVVPTASLGDFVWDDKNGNGIQESTELGVSGVIVNLFGTDQDGNPVSRTTTTDASGKYLFDDLVPGDYYVEFIRPTGYTGSDKDQGTDDTKDSDADKITGKTGTISLASGDNNLTVDAGIFRPAKLGDYVWEDKNYNGIQETGESPIQGVVVKLLDAAGQPAKDADGNPVASTTTDAAGLYKFENLKPGVQYVVEFTKPAGYEPTSKDKGTDDTKDSDADVTTGKAAPVVLASG